MSIFEQVEQLAEDFNTLWGATRQSETALKDITDAVDSRIKADMAAANERIDTLTKQAADPARPEVIRRLAAAELERVKNVGPTGPTQAERDAFAAEMGQARAALRDAIAIRQKLYDILPAAKRELEEIRSRSIGSQSMDVDLAAKWLDGRQSLPGIPAKRPTHRAAAC